MFNKSATYACPIPPARTLRRFCGGAWSPAAQNRSTGPVCGAMGCKNVSPHIQPLAHSSARLLTGLPVFCELPRPSVCASLPQSLLLLGGASLPGWSAYRPSPHWFTGLSAASLPESTAAPSIYRPATWVAAYLRSYASRPAAVPCRRYSGDGVRLNPWLTARRARAFWVTAVVPAYAAHGHFVPSGCDVVRQMALGRCV